MIKSIHIQNFQSHANTELEFSPGVNVIVGTSDSGKTAIIRALRWVRWNRPSGDAFRSKWGGGTSVLVECEEAEVSRIKDKSDKFLLRPKGRDEMEFKAFGTNVPEEIVALLNLDEINLQSQHDAPFLISDTPGAVAAHFNKVAHLDKIDTATSKINGWLRGLKSDIEHTEVNIESEKTKLEAFTNLDKFEAELEVLEALVADLTNLKNRKEALQKDIKKLQTLQVDIITLEDFIIHEPLIDAILDLITKRDEERKQYGDLLKIVKKLAEIKEDEELINHLLEAEPLIDDMIDKSAQVKALQLDHSKLKSLIKQIGQCQSDISTTETNLKESEELFHKEMGDVCILCGSALKVIIKGDNLIPLIKK